MLLHTLGRSPAHNAFHDCLAALGPGDALLLLGDGVYAARVGSQAAALLAGSGASLFVLDADASLAGVRECLAPQVTLVDDDGFVALSERYSRHMAWY